MKISCETEILNRDLEEDLNSIGNLRVLARLNDKTQKPEIVGGGADVK